MRTRAALLVGVFGPAFLTAGPCHALSLRSSAAEIFLGDARPGSMAVVGNENGRLSVENTGSEKAQIEISIEHSAPERLKDGYDPLPEIHKRVAAANVGKPLEPGEKRELDVKVAIPSSRHLDGGQYQFDCLIKGRSAGGSVLAMRTVVTLAVGEGEPPDVPRQAAGEGFSVSPLKAHLDGIPLGVRAAARSGTFRALKLANAGDSELIVRATPVRAWDESVRIEDGYAPAPNPHWLKPGPALRVKPGEVSEASFTLEIPRQDRYRGRRWAFVVAVDARAGDRIGRSWWTLHVSTIE